MKAVFCLLLLGMAGLQAQGTLQFNRVLMVSTVDTVPANKVWKVTSALSTSTLHTTGTNVALSTSMLVDGNTVFLSGRSYQDWSADGNQSFGVYTPMPVWLPAQTSLAAGANTLSLSVIEFNVLP